MREPHFGAGFDDTVALGADTRVDVSTLPRIDAAAGFAALVGVPEPDCWELALALDSRAHEVPVAGEHGASPVLLHFLRRPFA